MHCTSCELQLFYNLNHEIKIDVYMCIYYLNTSGLQSDECRVTDVEDFFMQRDYLCGISIDILKYILLLLL